MTLDEQDAVDARLERLRRETEGIRAPAGFSGRVLTAIEMEATFGWTSVTARAARRVVALAVIAAAVAGFLASRDEERVNEAMAASFGEVEVDF